MSLTLNAKNLESSGLVDFSVAADFGTATTLLNYGLIYEVDLELILTELIDDAQRILNKIRN